MWQIQEAHHWVMKPWTAYERRRELRVRESRHTFMEWDKKYYDCESGKYILDKMPSINSYSWDDITEPEDNYTERYLNRSGWATGKNIYVERQKYREETEKWFEPKDNDFDDECRRDEEIKLAKEREYQKLVAQREQELNLRYEGEIKTIISIACVKKNCWIPK